MAQNRQPKVSCKALVNYFEVVSRFLQLIPPLRNVVVFFEGSLYVFQPLLYFERIKKRTADKGVSLKDDTQLQDVVKPHLHALGEVVEFFVHEHRFKGVIGQPPLSAVLPKLFNVHKSKPIRRSVEVQENIVKPIVNVIFALEVQPRVQVV